jgi:hypothetical protein
MALSAKALGIGLGDALEPGGSESVGWITKGLVSNELAVRAQRHDDAEGDLGSNLARSTASVHTPNHDDAIPGIDKLVSLEAKLLEALGKLLEGLAYPFSPVVRRTSHIAAVRDPYDLGIHKVEDRLPVATVDGVQRRPHLLDVLLWHGAEYEPRTRVILGWEALATFV